MGKKVAVVVFGIVYPTGGTGGNHRQFAAVRDSAKQFGCFFHNGKVSCEVGVKYFLETKAFQRRNHFTRNQATDGHIKFFTERCAYSRCGLYNHILACLHSRVNLVDFGNFHKRARRANAYALTAQDTGGVCKASVFRRCNDGVEAALFKAEDTQAVRVFTSFYASAAKDTFRGISYDGRGQFIQRGRGLFALIHIVARARYLCNVQQFTLAVLFALLAVLVVVGKKKLYRGSSCRRCFGGGNGDFHAFRYGIYARCNQTSRARCFYQANTAGAFGAFAIVECAKGGDFKAAAFCRFENGHACFYFKRETFNFNIYFRHNHTSPYFFTIALNLQVAIHIPHFTHFDWSMVYAGNLLPGAI